MTTMLKPASCEAAGVPFLRWAGSKRQLIPILRRFWQPTFRRYVEPFVGSACLFFAIRPNKALLGDINPDLIATYIEIKHRAQRVALILRKLSNDRQSYLRVRSLNPGELDQATRAARFIYLNRFCFNGLYRTNAQGEFNVPYGGVSSGSLASTTLLNECSKTLRSARVVCADFERVLDQTEPDDFVYMDPPFAVSSRRVFNEYGPTSFSIEDIERLRKCMETLAMRGVKFVLSYADSREADVLAKGFNHVTVRVRRNIAGFAHSRHWAREILVFNG
jgi:DNA adenine methylase